MLATIGQQRSRLKKHDTWGRNEQECSIVKPVVVALSLYQDHQVTPASGPNTQPFEGLQKEQGKIQLGSPLPWLKKENYTYISILKVRFTNSQMKPFMHRQTCRLIQSKNQHLDTISSLWNTHLIGQLSPEQQPPVQYSDTLMRLHSINDPRS